MSRSREPWEIDYTPQGNEVRLKAATKQCRKVLLSPMAQYTNAPDLGMSFKMTGTVSRDDPRGIRFSLPRYEGLPGCEEDVSSSFTKIRPFTLRSEPIHGPKIAKSLRQVANRSVDSRVFDSLEHLWSRDSMADAGNLFVVSGDGSPLLPHDGMNVWEVAEEYLYTRVVKVGDTERYLSHIDDEFQLWCVARYIGDLIAIVAYQEYLIHEMVPKICPELTSWSGDQYTIKRRREGSQA